MGSLNRSGAIDIFRGIGIMLVVLGHVKGVPDILHKAIYSFHMPAFFLLSGYLFNPRKAGDSVIDYAKAKFLRLVIPAWTIGLICGTAFVLMLVLGKIGASEFATRLWGTLVGFPRADQNFMSTPLWFLFCLFCLEFGAALISKLAPRMAWTAILGIGAVFLAFSRQIGFIPFDAHVAGSAAFFFGVGLTIREKAILNFNQKPAMPAAALTLLATVITWTSIALYSPEAVDLSGNFMGSSWTNICINIVAALIGTATLYLVSMLSPDMPIVRWFGTHTLPILGFNYLVGAAVNRALAVGGIEYWPLSFLMQMAVLGLTAWIIDRTGILGDLINGRTLRAYKAQPASSA